MPATKLLLASLFVTFTAAACGAQLETTQINAAPRPLMTRPAASVDLFSSGPPARAHVDLAVIEAQPGAFESSTPELINRMREQAARMGCDGLVLNAVNNQLLKHGGERTTATGTCIVYTGPDPAALTASAPLPPPPVAAPEPAPAAPALAPAPAPAQPEAAPAN